MKTNQAMIRPMGQFQVVQRTKDGMFNATALIKQWNEHAFLNRENSPYLKQKDLKEFFTTKERKNLLMR